MKLSTKGRYGTRAIPALALHYGKETILARAIATRQDISERCPKQLLISLKPAGMGRSTRGAHGGFSLVAPPSQTRVSEIVKTLEGSPRLARSRRVIERASRNVRDDLSHAYLRGGNHGSGELKVPREGGCPEWKE